MSSLAGAYSRQGNYSDAEVLYKQCLDKMKIVLGESHPDTLTMMNNLACSYSLQGKSRDAEVILKQCLAKQIVAFGERHPDTLPTMNNLALLRSQSKLG